jgi:serine/threonine protein kinase/Tfp pilus assembly protein PilF
MASVTRICRKCGAKIFSDAPEGLCTGCVLETALGIFADTVAGVGDPGPLEKLARAEVAPSSQGKTTARAAKLLGELGDYELLEEIGRGGQGVVFRARQKSLNRTVALKVIGLGQWATPAHLKRFRLEAEAAASLDHPCIVPIYEVGERDGQCYFSMKFVEGGQFDEVIQQRPISVRQAAELIAKIAHTVHYAHEHGILHRDIKPGNILLDAKGEPHLTDFGLARLVESESTVTRTLEVLGTPSYMAPEQAAGRPSQGAAVSSPPRATGLTKAVDVYGLGSVLYQLLTSHPPFAGGTTYETIKLLLETEPRLPHLWNSKIDRDLSTICLKCLEKDPQRRYSSALALAQDLEHWLRREPIQARRSGVLLRGKKWLQRNPSAAAVAMLSLALIAAVGMIVWKSEVFRRPATAGVAVLPFENLSSDADNAYFAEGIQEEILTRLASIADLKVISRTSTQRYQSKPRNLSQIAKQLGVANILEGSVQKAADQVRVNVQLINAQTDSHLWADTYDRKLTDIFGVESEIAKGIADSLQAKLTSREEQALAVKPTNNPEAYDAYLRGLAFEAHSDFDALEKAIGFYEQAVQLDPNFALAWARLSRGHARLYFREAGDITAARRDAAKTALDTAQKLRPNSSETLLALGYYQFWVLRDYALAKTTFKRVQKMLPGSSDALMGLAAVGRREGHWDQSVVYREQALALDPRNVELLVQAASTHAELRQFQAALKLYDRALDIIPNEPNLMASKAGIYQAEGNLEQAAKFLSQINAQTPSPIALGIKMTQLRLERNYAEVIRLLQARQARLPPASETIKAITQVELALHQRVASDTAGAKVAAEQARNTLKQLCKDQPDNPDFAALLSLAYAALGEKDSAFKEAERAITLLPSAKDRVYGPGLEENLAVIQTMSGANSQAISTLARLLQMPYYGGFYFETPVTPALLRLDPLWDPLRGDPAFQKLCEEQQP